MKMNRVVPQTKKEGITWYNACPASWFVRLL